MLKLQEFIKYKPGVINADADALSRQAWSIAVELILITSRTRVIWFWGNSPHGKGEKADRTERSIGD